MYFNLILISFTLYRNRTEFNKNYPVTEIISRFHL